MSNGVISLDAAQASSNDGSTTSDQTSDSDDAAELRDVCEMIGADYDHATAYVDKHGNKSDLIDFAQQLAGDDELWATQEQYRRMNDIHRIIRNHLRPHDLDFTTYTGAFYGNSDDPEPGTYNHVQQKSREADGNLMFYRALFPEPVTDYWDSDAVLWQEFDSLGYNDDEQDSHIYVTADFVDEYGNFTVEVNGQEKPRPPANSEVGDGGGASSGSDSSSENLILDPAEYTVEGLRDELQEYLNSGAPAEDFARVLEAEEGEKDRKTAKKAIKGAKNEADSRDDAEQQDISEAAAAGDVNSKPGVDIDPEEVKEYMEMGWSKDEIIELLG